MANVLTFFGWLVTHWYIVVAIGAVAFAAAFFYFGRSVFDLLRVAVEFFKTPVGQMIAIGVAGFLLASACFSTGRNYERAKCDAEDLREQLKAANELMAAKDLQLKQAQESQKTDAERASKAETELNDLRGKASETPANSRPCLDPDALRRVYQIR